MRQSTKLTADELMLLARAHNAGGFVGEQVHWTVGFIAALMRYGSLCRTVRPYGPSMTRVKNQMRCDPGFAVAVSRARKPHTHRRDVSDLA